MTRPMPAKRLLGAKKREILIEWINDRANTFTIKEVEEEFEVHYQTAFNWVRTLETEGLVQVVDSAGKTNLYRACAPVGGFDPESMNARALRITSGKGKEELSIAEWAVSHMQSAGIPRIAHGLIYLFVRSYYYDAPDHQHLRGVMTPLEVRTAIEKDLRDIEDNIAIVRQILSLRVPWVEGPTMSLRFGAQPAGFDLARAVEASKTFQEALGLKETRETNQENNG